MWRTLGEWLLKTLAPVLVKEVAKKLAAEPEKVDPPK